MTSPYVENEFRRLYGPKVVPLAFPSRYPEDATICDMPLKYNTKSPGVMRKRSSPVAGLVFLIGGGIAAWLGIAFIVATLLGWR